MPAILVEFYKRSRKAVFGALAAAVLAFQTEIVPFVEGNAGAVASSAVAAALTGVVVWLIRNDGDTSNDDTV